MNNISQNIRYPHDLNTKFYSYDDLLKQMKSYLKRSNNIPMQVLNWLTPLQKREQLKSNANASLSN